MGDNLLVNFVYKCDTVMIFLLFLVNVAVYILTIWAMREGKRVVEPYTNLKHGIIANAELDNIQANNLQSKRDLVLRLYSAFSNITAIFPLLGILGTVAALCKRMTEVNMMQNLQVALDTTLYGVLFAIVFKIADAFIAGGIEAFIDDADYVIRQADDRQVLADKQKKIVDLAEVEKQLTSEKVEARGGQQASEKVEACGGQQASEKVEAQGRQLTSGDEEAQGSQRDLDKSVLQGDEE